MTRKLSRAMGAIILGNLLLLPMVTPAAATIETFEIIFTPTSRPAPSGSFTLNVTCTNCNLAVSIFDITDTPAAEWTPADAGGLTATVNGSGIVTSLDSSYGVLDNAPPPAIRTGDMFLGFGAFGPNTYNIAGSDPALAPDIGTYELVQLATVPEPVASGLLLAGLAACGVLARWRRHRLSGYRLPGGAPAPPPGPWMPGCPQRGHRRAYIRSRAP